MAVINLSDASIKTGGKRTTFWDQEAVANSFFSIATVDVGSGGASNIEFTDIPQTYTHLQIRASVISSVAERSLRINFNSDTGNNYSYHLLEGNGSTTGSSAGTSIGYGIVGITPNSTVYPGVFVCDIIDYRNTNKFKTIRSISGGDNNGVGGYTWFISSNWRSTNAITSIKIIPSSGNWSQYSSFALYGVMA